MRDLSELLDRTSLFYLSYIIAFLLWVLLLPVLANYYIVIGWDMKPRILMLSVPIYVAINVVAIIIYYFKVTRTNKIERVFLELLGGILIVVSTEVILFILGLDVMAIEFALAVLQISVIVLATYELATRIKKKSLIV